MATQVEEQQARDFLKRAEIRTMKKDLRSLRESDALKERDKIAKLKTLEEQLEELKATQDIKNQTEAENLKIKEVLQTGRGQEKLAEKNLKNYATEQERQQIFLFESERLNIESQIDEIEKKKDPALQLEKNKNILLKRNLEEKLKPILDQETKLEAEQNILIKQSQETNIPSQKKSLEQRRWDIDKEIQEIEKKRWAIEKQVQEAETMAKETDIALEKLITEKNNLESKLLGADKSLRDIFSAIMARVEERKLGQAEEQKAKRQALAEEKAKQNESVQREQWTGMVAPQKKEFLRQAPENFKEKLAQSVALEEEQRKQFLKNVENWAENK